eukprot:gb/GEZN01006425.1/.p1 GENE.gb/GEZN01006425.1/~~gb/GEZN01006425.1/.p1  ORF type:complete len:312 (+),score=44.96 gb/GEZN01006425.1/:74-1009(+)
MVFLLVTPLALLGVMVSWLYFGRLAGLALLVVFWCAWWLLRDQSEWRTGRIDSAITEPKWIKPGPIKFYFKDDWNKSADQTQLKQLVFAVHPHGPMSQARVMLFLWPSKRWNLHLPWIPVAQKLRMLAARALFLIPIMRELAVGSGCVDAGKKTAQLCLRSGISLMLDPGGMLEQVHSRPDAEVVWIKKRLGFIRLAIAEQVPVVPVYVFGESDLYTQRDCFRHLRIWIAKHLWVGIPGVLPLPPNRITLHAVFGSPIHPPELRDAEGRSKLKVTDPLVTKLHSQYVAALTDLYQEYKGQFGYETRPLLVM